MTIALIVGSVVLAWAVFTFNRLIRLRQLGDNAWADIDVQLKRRHDLIPSVVAVVQGHAGWTDFAFGEPSVALLPDGTLLLTLWCIQPDGSGIRFVKMRA